MQSDFNDFNKMLSETVPYKQESLGQSVGGQMNELYIFPPISFMDHASAKLLYIFAGHDSHLHDSKISRLIEKAHNIDGNPVTNNFGNNLNKDAFDYFALDRNIDNPERTSHLSTHWSFVYVSHSPRHALDIKNDQNILDRNDIRIITYGFFHQPPVDRIGYSETNENYNHSAYLIPTHKTAMNVLSAHNSFGSEINYKTMLDTDIYNEDLNNLLIDPSQDGKSLLIPHNVDEYLGPRSVKHKYITTNFSDPKTHMSRFVKGLSNLYSSERYSRENAALGFTGPDLTYDSVYNVINDNTTKQNLIEAFDMDKNRLEWYNDYTHINDFGGTSLGELINKVNVKIIILESDNSNFINNSADTYTRTHKYNYTSILASVGVSFMHHQQLHSVSFRYSSYEDIFQIEGQPQFIVTLSQEKMKQKINAFMELVKYRIFKWIQNDLGEFELTASLNTFGNSYIKLDPDSHTNYKDEYVAIPSITGGLSTPLLGGVDELHQNADQIDLLSSIISNESDTRSFT